MKATMTAVTIFLCLFAGIQALRLHSKSEATFLVNKVNFEETGLTDLDEHVEITFDDHHVSFHGCNTYFGDIEVDADTGDYELGAMVNTLKLCFKADHDEQVHQALEDGKKISVQGDILKIFNSDNEILLTGTKIAAEGAVQQQEELEESEESASEDSNEISTSVFAQGNFQLDPLTVQAITPQGKGQGQIIAQQRIAIDPIVVKRS